MLNTPILLITFNRPNHTRKVLERIVEAQPKDLYIFRDHWREDRADEQAKCEQVISVVKELTDNTGINVQYLLPETNLGCGAGPMTGISWFFENVEQGIVMEDDCLAHPDFFPYCEELLNRYKDNKHIGFIASTLYDDRAHWECVGSYGYSHYMTTGAWAAWRRTWDGFDLDLQNVDAKEFYKKTRKLLGDYPDADYWYFKMMEIQRDTEKKSYWDYQMQMHLFMNEVLTIHPKVNLISNIGFDPEGTHTTEDDGRGNKPTYSIMPLVYNDLMDVNLTLDNACFCKWSNRGYLRDKFRFFYYSLVFGVGLGHRLLMLYKKIKGVPTDNLGKMY